MNNHIKRIKIFLACLAACFTLAIAAPAQIVFTEIHSHPGEGPAFNADGTPYLGLTNDIHEFVEIQNTSGSMVDVSGWTLGGGINRKSTRLNFSHPCSSYAVFGLKN